MATIQGTGVAHQQVCIRCGIVTRQTYCPQCKPKGWRPGTRSGRQVDAKHRRLRAAVLQRDPVCRWCGKAPSTTLDHVVPVSRGGRDCMTNCVGSCAACNGQRGADG